MEKVIETHHDLETIYRLGIGQLSRGVLEKNHPFREVAMATTADGWPNIRTVILRKVGQDPFSVFVYTDSRSDKAAELEANPNASFLFWHPAAKFQLKLKTKVAMHRKDEIADEHYRMIGVGGRRAYNTADAPGTVIEAAKNPVVELKAKLDDYNFCVLECRVVEMEALQLSHGGHIRCRFEIVKNNASFIVP